MLGRGKQRENLGQLSSVKYDLKIEQVEIARW